MNLHSDEVQRVPDLFSYLQGMVDEDPRPGRFVLTGSQNLALLDGLSQSLAGRTTLTELLPLSLAEIRRFPDPPSALETLVWQGGYPRIYERGPLFETWILGEIAKAHLHRGRRPRMFFYREQNRLEIDLVLERGADLTVIEIKSARTPSGRHFAAFDRLAETLDGRDAPRISDRIVIYGGDETQARSAGTLLSWRDLDDRDWLGR